MDADSWTAGWEGNRLVAYWDETGDVASLGSEPAGTCTIGVGHTGPEVVPGLVWTQDHVDAVYASDTAIAATTIAHLIPDDILQALLPARYAALRDVAFEIGQTRLRGFVLMLAAVRAGNFIGAAVQINKSLYAKESSRRAAANSKLLSTGVFPAVHPNNSAIT